MTIFNVINLAGGIALFLYGMGIMTSSVEPLRDSPLFVRLFTSLQNPLLGVLAGILVTVAIQSSSASVGILQALSSTGVVTWGSAIPIILGQNIGTCSTPLIASVGASKAAKRGAVVHLYFNVIGTAVFMAVIYGLKALLHFDWWDKPIGMGDIANFHTLFNVVVTVLFIPFVRGLAKLAEQVEPLEETIDLMIETMRDRHIRRLKSGECQIDSGTIFLEVLTNLERIGDHCSNIAARIVGSEADEANFDAHAFRRNMHEGFVPNFNQMLARYKDKYYEPLCRTGAGVH